MTLPYSRQSDSEQCAHNGDSPGRGFETVVPNPKLKLMDQVREVLRLRHYSIRTERCYCRSRRAEGLRRRIKADPAVSRTLSQAMRLYTEGNKGNEGGMGFSGGLAQGPGRTHQK